MSTRFHYLREPWRKIKDDRAFFPVAPVSRRIMLARRWLFVDAAARFSCGNRIVPTVQTSDGSCEKTSTELPNLWIFALFFSSFFLFSRTLSFLSALKNIGIHNKYRRNISLRVNNTNYFLLCHRNMIGS